MQGWQFWWGIAAFFLGGLATQLNGWLGYKRQRKDRADDAADALRARREDFELEHLMASSGKLHAYREAFLNFASTCRQYRTAPPERRDERFQAAEEARVALLSCEGALHDHVGFILQSDIRSKVQAAVTAIELGTADALTGDEIDFGAVGREINVAFDALSTRVRDVYAGRAGT